MRQPLFKRLARQWDTRIWDRFGQMHRVRHSRWSNVFWDTHWQVHLFMSQDYFGFWMGHWIIDETLNDSLEHYNHRTCRLNDVRFRKTLVRFSNMSRETLNDWYKNWCHFMVHFLAWRDTCIETLDKTRLLKIGRSSNSLKWVVRHSVIEDWVRHS